MRSGSIRRYPRRLPDVHPNSLQQWELIDCCQAKSALSSRIYHHINPYGIFELDMAKRLLVDMGETL